MKIKKFPQSCVLIETNNTKILIDPSAVNYDEKFLEDWKSCDAILVTHRHSDHINADVISNLNKPIYSTQEVKKYYTNLEIKIIKENDEFNIGNIKIKVVKAIHGYVVLNGEVKENVGFILDDDKKKVYITSDTIRYNGIENNKCDVLIANCTAFDASMNLWGTAQTFKEVGAKTLIVTHQDAGKMFYSKEQIENFLSEQNINYLIPNNEDIFEI